MIELVAAAAAAGLVKNLIDIVNTVGDKWLYVEENGKSPKGHIEHGTILNAATVTRGDLSQRLHEDDLRHLKALEARMKQVANRWDHVASSIELETNLRNQSTYQQQMDQDSAVLAGYLKETLDFIVRCGFVLDDHYIRMWHIAEKTARGVSHQ